MAIGIWQRIGTAASDKWGLLATGLGAGAAWALQLPLLGVAVVGAGMFATAVVAGVVRGDRGVADESPPLRVGTTQYRLLQTLIGYQDGLAQLVDQQQLPSAFAVTGSTAMEAAGAARTTATRVAVAVDALEAALTKAGVISVQTPGRAGVDGSLDRMLQRRQALLADLEAAVGGVAEVYAKLLELSTTSHLAGMDTDGAGQVTDVNLAIDGLREAFAVLELEARRPGL